MNKIKRRCLSYQSTLLSYFIIENRKKPRYSRIQKSPIFYHTRFWVFRNFYYSSRVVKHGIIVPFFTSVMISYHVFILFFNFADNPTRQILGKNLSCVPYIVKSGYLVFKSLKKIYFNST